MEMILDRTERTGTQLVSIDCATLNIRGYEDRKLRHSATVVVDDETTPQSFRDVIEDFRLDSTEETELAVAEQDREIELVNAKSLKALNWMSAQMALIRTTP